MQLIKITFYRSIVVVAGFLAGEATSLALWAEERLRAQENGQGKQ